jgi:hypothetical protein
VSKLSHPSTKLVACLIRGIEFGRKEAEKVTTSQTTLASSDISQPNNSQKMPAFFSALPLDDPPSWQTIELTGLVKIVKKELINS